VTNVTDANSCSNTGTGSAVITVTPGLTVTFSPVGPFCVNAAAVDLSSAVAPAGGTFSGPGISGNMFDPATAGVGTHSINYSVTSGGCTASANQNITVNALPTATVSGSATICAGSSTTLTAALTGTGPWNVTWSDGVTQSAVAASPATRSVSPPTTTTYTVTSVSDANCTGTTSGSAVITVKALPTATVSGDAEICAGSSTMLTAALTGTGPWNVTWSDGVTQTGVATSPATRSVSPATTTTYTVTSVTSNGCSNTGTGSATITVNPTPVANAGSDQTVNSGQTVQIGGSPTASGGTPGYTYSWSPTVGLDDPTAANPNATVTSTTPYTVTVTDSKGCTATDQVVLTVGSSNLALNKTVTASSSRPAHPSGNSVDGNTSTHWRSDMVSSSIHAWLRVDLGATYSIGSVVINWSGSFYAKKYTVQVSLTGAGGSWTTVHTDNAGNGGVDNITFAAVSARYVRVHMTQHNEQVERINEFEVYAASGSLSKESEVEESEVARSEVITDYALEQNYPNPFNPTTVISFQLPVNNEVKLAIYSITGQLVRELVNGEMAAGRQAISWDGRDQCGHVVAAGVYLYRLVVQSENGAVVFSKTQRMAFVK